MLHEPAQDHGEDRAAPYKMRLGVWMFCIYAIIYVGFVVINTVKPTLSFSLVTNRSSKSIGNSASITIDAFVGYHFTSLIRRSLMRTTP